MKGLSVFLSLVAVLAAGVSAALYLLVGDERDRLQTELDAQRRQLAQAQQQIEDLKAERSTIATNLASIDGSVNETRARNTTLEARNSQLTREILQAREQIQAYEKAGKAAEEEVSALRRQLVDAQSRVAVSPGPAPMETLAASESRVADLEAQLATLRRISGNDSIPATAEQLARVPDDLLGHVVEVGPRSAFVVLDIGTRHGAVPALELVLRRGSNIVARLRLTDVRESFSIAHVLPHAGILTPIRAGDTASKS
jgi:septal ring factor EnvC (AmiA/AmiB activator)